jgi:hypothetical protein
MAINIHVNIDVSPNRATAIHIHVNIDVSSNWAAAIHIDVNINVAAPRGTIRRLICCRCCRVRAINERKSQEALPGDFDNRRPKHGQRDYLETQCNATHHWTPLLHDLLRCEINPIFRAFGGGKSAQKSQRYAGILYS